MRKQMLLTGLLTAGFLFTSLGARAQDLDRRYAEFRDPVAHVRSDLDRAEHDVRYLPPADLRRFDRAHHEIAEFDRRWEHGRFDRHELDDIIQSLRAVVENNHLRPPDREVLAADLDRLRDIRGRFR